MIIETDWNAEPVAFEHDGRVQDLAQVKLKGIVD